MRIRLNEYNLESPKIDQSYDILAVSDIHSNLNALRSVRSFLTDKTKILTISGDTIDHVESCEKKEIIEELKYLSSRIKVLISRGNHEDVILRKDGRNTLRIPTNDLSFFDDLKSKTDCVVMTDTIETHEVDKSFSVSSINMPTIWYRGGENREEFYQALSSNSISIDKDKFNILLSHTPNPLIRNNELVHLPELDNMDLILSGHNHGGLTPMFIQNRSKNHTGLVGPNFKIGKPNAFGYYTTDDTSLIISNGVTKVAPSTEFLKYLSIVNNVFIPDFELIHLASSDSHSLKLSKRKTYPKLGGI